MQKEVELSLHARNCVRALLAVELVAEGVAGDAEYTVFLGVEERMVVVGLLFLASMDGLLQE